VNPAQAHRKKMKKKAIARQKEKQKEMRDLRFKHMAPDRIMAEIRKVERQEKDKDGGISKEHARVRKERLRAAHESALKREKLAEKKKAEQKKMEPIVIKGLTRIFRDIPKEKPKAEDTKTGNSSFPSRPGKLSADQYYQPDGQSVIIRDESLGSKPTSSGQGVEREEDNKEKPAASTSENDVDGKGKDVEGKGVEDGKDSQEKTEDEKDKEAEEDLDAPPGIKMKGPPRILRPHPAVMVAQPRPVPAQAGRGIMLPPPQGRNFPPGPQGPGLLPGPPMPGNPHMGRGGFPPMPHGGQPFLGPGRGMPPHGMPPHGMVPQGMPPHGRPPQGMPPHGIPPHGIPPQMAPGRGMPWGQPNQIGVGMPRGRSAPMGHPMRGGPRHMAVDPLDFTQQQPPPQQPPTQQIPSEPPNAGMPRPVQPAASTDQQAAKDPEAGVDEESKSFVPVSLMVRKKTKQKLTLAQARALRARKKAAQEAVKELEKVTEQQLAEVGATEAPERTEPTPKTAQASYSDFMTEIESMGAL